MMVAVKATPERTRRAELRREFDKLLEGLVLATAGNDRPRMQFLFERIQGRYSVALENVSIGTLESGETSRKEGG